MTYTELKQEVLKLSEEERAGLLECIVGSLADFEDFEAEISPAWVAEIRLRDEQYKAGRMSVRPMEEVLGELERKLDEQHQIV